MNGARELVALSRKKEGGSRPPHVDVVVSYVECSRGMLYLECCQLHALSIIAGVPLLIFSDLVWLVWPGLARLGLVLLVLGSFHAVEAVS